MFRTMSLSYRARLVPLLIGAVLAVLLPRSAQGKAPTPPAPLAMTTVSTVYLRGTFTTTGQNLRGPGPTPPAADETMPFFDKAWNNSGTAGGVATINENPCSIIGETCGIQGDFGAEVSASTRGRVAMGMTYKNATTGTVNITYPITIRLTITTDYAAAGAKTVTIDSALTVDPGAQITTTAPTFDGVSLDYKFGFHAGISGRVCFFACTSLTAGALQLDIPNALTDFAQGQILNIPASDFTTVSGYGRTFCFNIAINLALNTGPYPNPKCGINGYVGFPEPKLTSTTNAGGVVTATGTDPFAIVPISSVAWAQQIAGLPPIPLNIGPINLAGYGIGYTTYNQIWTGLFNQNQTLTFDPDIDVSLQLPRAMAYTVRDQANAIVTTATSATVTFLAGHKVAITVPGDQPLPMSMTPTLSVRTTGTNFTYAESKSLSFEFKHHALKLYLKHPGYVVDLDFGALGRVTFTALPPVDINLGPLFEETIPLGTIPLSSYTPAAWNISGFNTIPLPPIQPPMLLLADNGIRGQTQVIAIAPSFATSFDCTDTRPGLRTVGADLDESSVRTLIYAGSGWHVFTCVVNTVSDGTLIGMFGMYVLSDPYVGTQTPAPPLDFGTPIGACNPRGFLLKNDTLKNFNLNSLGMSGPHATAFKVVSGGDPNQMGPLQPGYGQVFALQYCKSAEVQQNAVLTFRGSLGTGAGSPAPVTVPLVGNGPNLSITKAQSTATPVTNQVMTYTISARANAVAFNGMLVRDTLPTGLSNINVANTAGFACTVTGLTVNCTGNLAANTEVVITITATVTASAGTVLTNTAAVDPEAAFAETSEVDNTATTTATVTTAPNLTITKSQDTGSPLTDGNLVYTVTATSTGGAASNVVVLDPIPLGTRFVSASATAGFGCVFKFAGTGAVECTGNLGSGGQVVVTVTVKVTAAAGAQITNVAVVDPYGTVVETNELDNNSNTVTATVLNGRNLSITKTQDSATPAPNAVLRYTVKAKATGGAISNVLVRDTLPASGVQLLDVSNNALFACPVTGNIINCTGNLASGQEVEITILVQVTAAGGAVLTNTATVDPDGTVTETNELTSDNTATVTATVSNPLNFTINKTRNGVGNPTPGTQVTYQIVVAAVGAPSNQVQVRDVLPDGLTFVSVSNTTPNALPTSFFVCSDPAAGTPKRVDCGGSLATNESVTITLVASVDNVPHNTVITNTAQVDPDSLVAEQVENDNSSSVAITVSNP